MRGTVWVTSANGNINRYVLSFDNAYTVAEFKYFARQHFEARNLGDGHVDFGPIGRSWR